MFLISMATFSVMHARAFVVMPGKSVVIFVINLSAHTSFVFRNFRKTRIMIATNVCNIQALPHIGNAWITYIPVPGLFIARRVYS